jgi:hypothetical protein
VGLDHVDDLEACSLGIGDVLGDVSPGVDDGG